MVLPRRARVAITLLAAMAYGQVNCLIQKHRISLWNLLMYLNHMFAFFRLLLESAPSYCTCPPPWQLLTSPALSLSSHWPSGFWQSCARCPSKSLLLFGEGQSLPATPQASKTEQCHCQQGTLKWDKWRCKDKPEQSICWSISSVQHWIIPNLYFSSKHYATLSVEEHV